MEIRGPLYWLVINIRGDSWRCAALRGAFPDMCALCVRPALVVWSGCLSVYQTFSGPGCFSMNLVCFCVG